MMYVNLILRNLKRSAKEYAVYMSTLTLSIMLIYSYNSLMYASQIKLMSERILAFQTTMLVISCIIVCVIAWLIYYISNFILQKRSKEFGIYLLMGMTPRQVALMFLAEQFALALLAFGIGCFLGIFAVQIMLMIIVAMFQQAYVLQLDFSIEGFVITAVFFLIIFLLESLREYYTIHKHKIYDLLYSEKKNEKYKKHKGMSYLYCVFACICFFLGCMNLNKMILAITQNQGEVGSITLIFAVGFLVGSVYLLFYGLAPLITQFINARKKLKYHGDTMYLYGQLSTHIRSHRTVLATLSILILSTLMFICIGIKFREAQEVGNETFFPYDIMAVGNESLDISAIQAYLEKENIAYQDHIATMYTMQEPFAYLDSIYNELDVRFGPENGTYISLSDYNALRALKGLKSIHMQDTEYILLVDDSQYFSVVNNLFNNQPLQIHGDTLEFHSMDTESIGQARMDLVNVVIPDAHITYGIMDAKVYNVCIETSSKLLSSDGFKKEFLSDNISELLSDESGDFYQHTAFVNVKADWVEENTFSSMIIIFCFYYFAIIFTCVSATILATQQMSDSMKQRQAYMIMWRMGVSKKELLSLMRKQIAIYFFIPMLTPILYAFPILYFINNLFLQTIAKAPIYPYFIVSLLFYSSINLAYYFLAYFGCKQGIKECL